MHIFQKNKYYTSMKLFMLVKNNVFHKHEKLQSIGVKNREIFI